MADAEETEGALHRDLRAAEAAAADRDELEARMSALQECLEETRAEQSQLSHYKKVAPGPKSWNPGSPTRELSSVNFKSQLSHYKKAAPGLCNPGSPSRRQ